MMRYDVRADVRELTLARDIRVPNVVRKATSRALNDTASKVRTQASREINKRLHLGVRRVRDSLRHLRSSVQRLAASVVATGKAIPLREFGARMTRRGVTVRMFGQRKLWRTLQGTPAFIVDRYGGHVFARKGRARTPIVKQYGPSIPSTFAHETVHRALDEVAHATFPDVFAHHFDYYAKRELGS